MKDTEKIRMAVAKSWGRGDKEVEALARKLKKRDAQLAALWKDRERLRYLLDQLSPSMYADHGAYALDQVAKAMRAVRSGEQLDAGLRAIDAAMSHTDAGEQGAAGGDL